MEPNIAVEKLPHHDQMEFCLSRAKYRQGRKLTAVKVYSVNDESKFLIISDVPALKISNEFETLCRKYGTVEFLKLLHDYPHEDFSEVYLVKYQIIKSARFAKKQLDGKSFYGGVLHVCYAPELESVDETREKLQDRRRSIAALTRYKQDPSAVNPSKKKISNPTIGRYLSQLRPELQVSSNELQLPQPSCDSRLKNRDSDEIHSVGLPVPHNRHSTAIIPAELYKIPNELSTINSTLKEPDVNKSENLVTTNPPRRQSRPTGSSLSGSNLPVSLVPRSVVRQRGPTMSPSRKKIKVFGNKSILSYKT